MTQARSRARGKWPLLRDDDDLSAPPNARCLVCKQSTTRAMDTQVVLSGGALLVDARGDSTSTKDGALEGFLGGTAHGPDGRSRALLASVDVVRELAGGQFDLYFCSTKCLRSFFSSFVDELDRRAQQSKHASKPRAVDQRSRDGLARAAVEGDAEHAEATKRRTSRAKSAATSRTSARVGAGAKRAKTSRGKSRGI